MAFGQTPGPPATHRQVQQLLALVEEAGHVDLRDARGPLGLTQRQAGGRFTRDEADELIARLEQEAEAGPTPETDDAPTATPRRTGKGPAPRRPASPRAAATATPRPKRATAASARRQAEQARRLADVSAADLAAELQRRGWVVMEP